MTKITTVIQYRTTDAKMHYNKEIAEAHQELLDNTEILQEIFHTKWNEIQKKLHKEYEESLLGARQ